MLIGIGDRRQIIILQAILLFASIVVLSAQPTDFIPEPIFPSDSQPALQAGGGELLEAVCPGNVGIGEDIKCSNGCPDYTGFGRFGDRFEWTLRAVTRGHFLSPTSEDAALWMLGCEPHSENFWWHDHAHQTLGSMGRALV